MDSVLAMSSPNACSIANGGNLWASKHSNKNIYHARCFALLVSSVFMDSMLAVSSPNACLVTSGGNLWRSKHSTKNIYYASSYASKASQYKRKTESGYKFLRFQQSSLNHLGGGSTYQECDGKYVMKRTSATYFPNESHDSHPKNILDFVKNLLVAMYMFSTPHIFFTQVLSITSTCLLAVDKLSNITPLFFIGVLQVVLPYLFMGIYIGGINQIYDLEIDKINKPYLPLASGQISLTTGVIVTASSLALSFWLGWTIGSWPLIWSLLLSCLLWTSYSINVPLLRWKGHPLLAALCIFATWAVIYPISFFLHMQTFVFKRPTIFPRSLSFTIAFMSFYFVGIALCKDIPDIEGDTKFGIYSFSARLGQKKVFWICVSLFEMALGVALLGGVTSPYLWIKIVTGLGHVVLASMLWYQAKSTDVTSKASISSFYMFIWKLLSAEYFLLSLLR